MMKSEASVIREAATQLSSTVTLRPSIIDVVTV